MDELTRVIRTDNIRLSDDGRSVVILDQTQLPNREVYLTLDREEDCYEAILKLRGDAFLFWQAEVMRP